MEDISTFVIVPTYNEADNINDLIAQLLDLPVNVGVVVVDDNSPDGTGNLADDWAVRHPGRVSVVHRAGKLGLGTAYIAGFKKALYDLNAARIMTMDADFSHNPRYIPAMIALSREKHVVIGSRDAVRLAPAHAAGEQDDVRAWRRFTELFLEAGDVEPCFQFCRSPVIGPESQGFYRRFPFVPP